MQLLACRREASWSVEARAEPGVTDRSWRGRKKWQVLDWSTRKSRGTEAAPSVKQLR